MAKRIFVFLLTFVLLVSFVGCSNAKPQQSSQDIEVIVQQETETIIQGGESSMTTSDNQNSSVTPSTSSVNNPVSSAESANSSEVSSLVSTPSEPEDDTINIDYEWKSHPQDFSLLPLPLTMVLVI